MCWLALATQQKKSYTILFQRLLFGNYSLSDGQHLKLTLCASSSAMTRPQGELFSRMIAKQMLKNEHAASRVTQGHERSTIVKSPACSSISCKRTFNVAVSYLMRPVRPACLAATLFSLILQCLRRLEPLKCCESCLRGPNWAGVNSDDKSLALNNL